MLSIRILGKLHVQLFATCFACLAFISCDPEIVTTFEAGSYWNSNDLVRMQLKGKVKSIKTDNETEYFNLAGNLDSIIDGYTYLQKCNYTDNRLTKCRVETKNERLFFYYYAYNNKNLYVPVKSNQWNSFTFIKGLDSYIFDQIESSSSPLGCVFQKTNDSTLVAVTIQIGKRSQYEYITYSGRFPVSSIKQYTDSAAEIGEFTTYRYAPSGELCWYECKVQHSNASTTTKRHYAQIGNYLLNDTTIVQTSVDSISSIVKTVHTYNPDGVLLRIDTSNGDYSIYTYYLTDAFGNWTWRTCLNKTGSLITNTTESRIIRYYD